MQSSSNFSTVHVSINTVCVPYALPEFLKFCVAWCVYMKHPVCVPYEELKKVVPNLYNSFVYGL